MDTKTQFRELVEQLIQNPTIPCPGVDLFEVDPQEVLVPNDNTFDTYCRGTVALVKGGQLGQEMIDEYLDSYREIAPFGDPMDYLTDLLRIVAEQFDDLALRKRTTEEHLSFLAEESFAFRGRATSNDHPDMRRARKAARRGLRIVESTTDFPISPDIHADLLLALGQTFARAESFSDLRLAEALTHYLKALDLKQAAGNFQDVDRLRDLLKRMIGFLLPTAQLAAAVGHGATLQNLELAHQAAQEIGEPALLQNVTLELANVYSAVRQPQLAEKLLREALETPGLTPERRDHARMALASSLSEQHRACEAAEIQESLISEDSPLLGDPHDRAVIWMNYGNSLRLKEDLAGARKAFETALASATKLDDEATAERMESQLRALLGEIWFLLGDPKRGTEAFEKAASVAVLDLSGTHRIHVNSLAGRCYFNAGMHDAALPHLDRARESLRQELEKGPRPDVWESMLNEWAYLDALTVEIQLAKHEEAATRAALVAAEAAKGRLLAWLRWGASSEKAPQIALSPERHEKALQKVEAWATEQPGRRLVSIFAGKGGLAVFVVGGGNSVSGAWLEDAGYDAFMSEVYEPWESLVDASAADATWWPAAGALTGLVLAKVGEWLWRACPELADGDNDLVLIPHRLFRSLPLSHCQLPGGGRLSDGFARVFISPSLYDFSLSLGEAHEPGPPSSIATALVDPDGSLPFARVEGIRAAGADSAKMGSEVTVAAVREALSTHGLVLISCHGDFDEANPWQSTIAAADGAFRLHELLDPACNTAADLVVLGACEAARTRRSQSDEPLGFPGMLVEGGVKAVLAPLWKVDDFSSLAFVSRFLEHLKQGKRPVWAAQETARWLRDLTAPDALTLADSLLHDVEELIEKNDFNGALDGIPGRLQQIQEWLRTLKKDARPFSSPLDWAAFQLVGVPRGV